jgi:hypothetical protein
MLAVEAGLEPTLDTKVGMPLSRKTPAQLTRMRPLVTLEHERCR